MATVKQMYEKEIVEKFEALQADIESVEKNIARFVDKGTKVNARTARVKLSGVQKLTKDLRALLLNASKDML
jgi:hypothetical protein